MPACCPPRYRLLDLVFALGGTLTFLLDLGSDVWGALAYYRAGDVAWAALLIGFYGMASLVLQLHSWGWFWTDRRSGNIWELPRDPPHRAGSGSASTYTERGPGELNARESASCGYGAPVTELDSRRAGNGHTGHDMAGNTECPGDNCTGGPCPSSESSAPVAAHIPAEPTIPGKANASCLQATAGNGDVCAGHETRYPGNSMCPPAPDECATSCNAIDIAALPGKGEEKPPGDAHTLTEQLLQHFYTSRHLFSPPCLALLHLLQLGYPLRCIHSLEVGIAAYRSSENNPTYDRYQEYAYFLTHDISMMRLMETFLENTPQLILLLYIVLHRGTIYTFQYFSISISFISISWAILDYHQSLRLFLKDKQSMNILSSIIYFLWNLLLIFSRIVCITLFISVFHLWVALHFLLLWIAFFLWATWQSTDFMRNRILEHFFRATVAVILYFSWFNIADGRTIYRCIVYYCFITADSVILFMSWKIFKFPSILDEYETYLLYVLAVFFPVGILFRVLYYLYLHPNLQKKKKKKEMYDEPDGLMSDANGYRLLKREPVMLKNPRIIQLSMQLM
eukprot:XP_012812573.1 PREDICTED: XK-related protein 8 isoform X1 [Xenopus tropicalis]